MYFVQNNTKISITSKRTGEITPILNTYLDESGKKRILVDDDNKHNNIVVAGFPFTEAVDGSLDTFVFTLKRVPTRRLFEPFDFIEFTVDDGIEKKERTMLVLYDHSKSYSKVYKSFEHTITCIEPVKILEKIKVYNLCLTNETHDLYSQVVRALHNAVFTQVTVDLAGDRVAERQHLLEETTKLSKFLEGKPSRDYYFSNTDMRTVLDTMLAPHNCRATVEAISFKTDIFSIKVGLRRIDMEKETVPVWTREEQGEIIGEEMENDGQNYAGKIVARGYNTVLQEPITFTDCFKTNKATLSDDTATAFFPFPISDRGIKKFEIIVNSTWYPPADSSNKIIRLLNVNIAERLLPLEKYEVLSSKKKEKYIPYEIGGSAIFIGGKIDKIIDFSKILTILEELIEEQYAGTFSDGYNEFGTITGTYKDFTFTATYYPLIDTVSEISKPGVYDRDVLLMGLMDSQTEKTLDVERHGKKLASLIKRTGNAEYYLDVEAKYYSKLLPLMAKISLPTDTEAEGWTDKNYVVYKKECAIWDNVIQCRYYLSKDFNAIHQDEGVNRERHLFDIPLESEETPLVIKKYLVFSDSLDAAETSYSSAIPLAALNTLIGKNESVSYTDSAGTTKTASGQLKYMLFQTQAGLDKFPQETENSSGETPYENEPTFRFMRPIGSYAQDKVMTFTARTLDNYSVDYSRDGYVFSIWGDKGNMITYNRYVSKKDGSAGEFRSFSLDLAFEFTAPEDTTKINRFPVVDRNDFVLASDYTIQGAYHKDRTQRPLFVFSFECVPAKKNYGDIIIGTEFAKNNNLIRDNGTGLKGLYLYASDTKTFEGSEDMLPENYNDYLNGTWVPLDLSEHDVASVKTTTNGAVFNAKPFGGDTIVGITMASWAIADAAGNIYLAANGMFRGIVVTVHDFPY